MAFRQHLTFFVMLKMSFSRRVNGLFNLPVFSQDHPRAHLQRSEAIHGDEPEAFR